MDGLQIESFSHGVICKGRKVAAGNPARLMGCGLTTILGTIAVLTALVFSYFLVSAGVVAAYHPDADFGKTFFILKVAVAFSAVAAVSAIFKVVLHRFGCYPTAPAVLGSAFLLWITIVGYLAVSQEPRPPFFEREFEGNVYRVRWEDANLGLETQYGTTRQRVSVLSYRTCLEPIAVGSALSRCRLHGFISIGKAKDADRDMESASEVFRALASPRSGTSGPAISVEPFYVDHRFKEERERQLAQPSSSSGSSSTSSGSSSTSSGGELSSGSSGGSTDRTVTYGLVQSLGDITGVYGFRQINPGGGSARYYFWKNAGPRSQVSHWAVCSVFRDSDGESVCRHSEINGRNYYQYAVPEQRNTDWQSLRDTLLSKVADQRVSSRR
jgi:uncharacterized membrane protein YgcG